jgi:peptidylprolyl isomerase
MKFLLLIGAFCIALALGACGNDDSSAEAGKSEAANTDAGNSKAADDGSKESEADESKPRIQPPSGPPPKEVVVKDLVEGTGPAAKAGDELAVRFVVVDQAGDEVYDTWTEKTPLTFKLGPAEYGSGWDQGLTGMKAGGQRELSIPADQAYEEQGPLYYVVKVLEVNPASSKDGAGQADGASRGQ